MSRIAWHRHLAAVGFTSLAYWPVVLLASYLFRTTAHLREGIILWLIAMTLFLAWSVLADLRKLAALPCRVPLTVMPRAREVMRRRTMTLQAMSVSSRHPLAHPIRAAGASAFLDFS